MDPRSFKLADFEGQKQAFLEGVRKEAAQILENARAKAQETLEGARRAGQEQARGEGEKAKAEAMKRGYDEGHKKGEEEGRRHMEEQLRAGAESAAQALAAAASAFAEEKTRLLKESENSLIDTAYALAKKILLVEPASNPKVLLAQLRQGLELLGTKTKLEVRLNPGDIKLAEKIFPQLAARMGERADVSWVADETLSPASVVMNAGDSQLDGRLEEQWRRLLEQVGRKET